MVVIRLARTEMYLYSYIIGSGTRAEADFVPGMRQALHMSNGDGAKTLEHLTVMGFTDGVIETVDTEIGK